MKILSIDTSSNICSVAILENKEVIKELHINDIKTHSEKLMPLVSTCLNECNLTLNDISLLACCKGPGSFTGIRIGIATVKAFSDSQSIETIGINSLLGLAYNVINDGLICSIIDAKNNNVYFGLFEHINNKYIQKSKLQALSVDETILTLKNETSNITFVGNGAMVYKNILQLNLSNSTFLEDESNNASSIGIGKAAFDNYSNKHSNDFSLLPLYLRKSQAERILEGKSNEN